MVRAATIAALLLGACGTETSPELVVRDVAPGGGVPSLLGADPDGVYWSVSAGSAPTIVAGSALVTLPASGQEIGAASGPIAHVGDHVVFSTDSAIMRASVTSSPTKVASVTAEKLAESVDPDPILVWTVGALVSWGNNDLMKSAMLTRIVGCDAVHVTATSIYVAAEGTSERRLLRIDRKTGVVEPLSASRTHGPAFPGGAVSGAAYRGRLVGADDSGASWLVEETLAGAIAPGRAILVAFPDQGEPTVLLEHVSGASAFFTTADGFFWQEGTALLTAARSGGAASIVGHLPAIAGAIDSGFVYFIDGTSIERLALDALD